MDNELEILTPETPKKPFYQRFFEDTVVGRALYNRRYGLLIFFLPVFIMWLCYSIFGVHPFGDGSVLVLDLNGQYVSYYEMLRDAIWGDKSLIYSWSRNLGGETMGMFGYYLASPFMWIIVLLPRTMMLGAIEIMQLAKIGCCALAFAYYLKKSKNASNYMQVIFSVTYALMTYIVVELMNPMWIDGMIWLPLIALGIENLVKNGKMLGLVLSLTIMFVSHFYIGYMLGFFSALYFIYCLFSQKDHAIAPNFLLNSVKFAVCAGVSVLSSAIVILPVYNSLKLGKLEFTDPDFTLKTQFDVFKFLSKLFTNSYDTVRPEGLPMLACGTLAILLLPLFFLNTKIPLKEKVANGALTLALFGCMYLSTVDIAWHGFQVPNWLPYRYSFIFCFMMLIMAFRALENIDGVSFKEIGLTAFGWVVLLAYLNSLELSEFYLGETVWFGILCLAVFAGVLFALKKYPTTTTRIILALFICLELFESTMYNLYSVDCDVVYSKYSSYQQYFIDGRDVVEQVEDLDDGFYRMEKTFHRTVNDPMGMGFAGLSHSSSTMNTPVLKTMKALGLGMQGHYTRYTGGTLLSDALLGVKYLMAKPTSSTTQNREYYESYLKTPSVGYNEVLSKAQTRTDIAVYENENVLSIGYMVSDDILSLKLDSNNPFDNQEYLLRAVLGDDKAQVFNYIYAYYTEPENCTTATTGDHIMYTTRKEGADSYVEFSFPVESSDPVYAFFPTIYQRKCNMWLKAESWDITNYAFAGYFFTGDNYSILGLGSHEASEENPEELHLRMTLANKEAIFSEALFVQIDTEKLAEYTQKIAENQWNITKHSQTVLEGTINAGDGGLMLTTIPYEPGWQITVDGEKVEPVKLLDSLIGLELEAGEHEIKMHFWPSYLTLAIIITAVGASFVAIIFILEYKNGKILNKILNKTR